MTHERIKGLVQDAAAVKQIARAAKQSDKKSAMATIGFQRSKTTRLKASRFKEVISKIKN